MNSLGIFNNLDRIANTQPIVDELQNVNQLTLSPFATSAQQQAALHSVALNVRVEDGPTQNKGEWREIPQKEGPNIIRWYASDADISGTNPISEPYYETEIVENGQKKSVWVLLNLNGPSRNPNDSEFTRRGWIIIDKSQVPATFTTEGKTVTIPNDDKQIDADRALLWYLQTHFVSEMAGDKKQETFDLAKLQGVKVESFSVEQIAEGRVVSVKISSEDLSKLRKIANDIRAEMAEAEAKAAQGRENANQMLFDQGRVLWNSGVNIIEGTINTGVDAMRSSGGVKPVIPNPYDPLHIDLSGVKSEYKSEMMRRDIGGEDGKTGITQGDAIEFGVTIGAPIVVGAAIGPKAPPQTLRSVGALPEETLGFIQTTKPASNLTTVAKTESGAPSTATSQNSVLTVESTSTTNTVTGPAASTKPASNLTVIVERVSKQTAEKLIAQAHQEEAAITNTVSKIARDNNGELVGLESRVKTVESLNRKLRDQMLQKVPEFMEQGMLQEEAINTALSKATNKLNDTVRYTMTFPTKDYVKGYESVVQSLKNQDYKIGKAWNAWDLAGKPRDPGYRGLNLTVTNPKGQTFEIQFHTPESFKTNKLNRTLYEEKRLFNTTIERKDELTRQQIESLKSVEIPEGAKKLKGN